MTERALSAAEPRTALRAVMRTWLPLSEAVLGMAVEQLPSPKQARPHMQGADVFRAVCVRQHNAPHF